jgi:hypothetical protein
MFFGYLPEPNIGIFLSGVVCAVIGAGIIIWELMLNEKNTKEHLKQ